MTQHAALIALVIHLAVTGVFLALMACGILKVKPYIAPFILFIPFWGALACLFLHFHVAAGKDGVADIPMEKLRIDDEIFKSLTPDTAAEKDVAPLNEVLMLAPSGVRRNMMLDILNDSPGRYAQALIEARSGDDTEVVHYATTAMAEMSKQHDIRLQRYENAFAAAPDDAALITEYSDYLEEYLSRGLLEGRAEKIARSQLVKLLRKRTLTDDSPEISERYVRQLILLGSYETAQSEIARMVKTWPKLEEPRLLEMECHAILREGDKLRECIRKAQEDGVYFSRKGREQTEFFTGSRTRHD